jgi:catechol 2,3-dioxygenase-like lactoylglutathione lyase family enzyme
MQQPDQMYDVGGVLMPRPFKVRRLGHFGYFFDDLDAGRDFYTRALGFRLTDEASMADLLPPELSFLADEIEDPRMFFTSYGGDHHAVLLLHSGLANFGPAAGTNNPEMTTNQITWQVGTLEEVQAAHRYLMDQGVQIERVGRDMPGGNWHVYFRDPDGFTNELYYGIEQIGWNRQSKPYAMFYRGFGEAPGLPQMGEYDEVAEALQKGIDIFSGYRPAYDAISEYTIGGVTAARPFKVTKLGPVGIFVTDVDRSEAFYTGIMGFEVTESVEINGRRCAFLRHGNEHHSLTLYPIGLRAELGLSEHTVVATLGVEVGTYTQLREAVSYLAAEGYTVVDLPATFHTGIDYAAHVLDPAGHCVELYYYMEQVGWDGKPRPAAARRSAPGPWRTWPSTIDALSDTYVDQIFQGPLS